MTIDTLLIEPTVLVLGAGASNPYGFPLGSELKDTIVSTYNETVHRALREKGYQDEIIKAFQDALKYGSHPNIDIFLERKRNFREVGAYFIAGAIGNQEVHEKLFPQKDWYADLSLALDLENTEQGLAPLSVVTLNYDRSFEHFLTKNIDYNCRYDCVESAHRKRQSLPIIHAHGSLGPYPDVPYGKASGDTQALSKAAESIRIVSDRLEDSPDFQKAQGILSNANHIVFLGFGFDDRTLHALLGKADLQRPQFYGSAYGLRPEMVSHVKEIFEGRITLGESHHSCADLLRLIGLVSVERGR